MANKIAIWIEEVNILFLYCGFILALYRGQSFFYFVQGWNFRIILECYYTQCFLLSFWF